jgi:putative transposase
LKESYSIKSLCQVFEVHRSSYGYWKINAKKIRVEDLHADIEVKAAHKLSGGSAGSRTIATLVTSRGYNLSRYRASKSMKRQGLVSCQPPTHNYKPANKPSINIENHLNREFSPIYPNQVWCGDVTYLWVGDRWRYLGTVLDLYSRKIVGFALSDSPDSELTKQALSNAFQARGKPLGVMFHSDQGCHYTSLTFRPIIWKYQIKQSMSRRGNCWDNAPMERFFRSLKTENMPKNGYENETAANDSVRDYIYKYYNSVRPHSHNLGLSPNEKEAFYWKTSNSVTKKG